MSAVDRDPVVHAGLQMAKEQGGQERREQPMPEERFDLNFGFAHRPPQTERGFGRKTLIFGIVAASVLGVAYGGMKLLFGNSRHDNGPIVFSGHFNIKVEWEINSESKVDRLDRKLPSEVVRERFPTPNEFRYADADELLAIINQNHKTKIVDRKPKFAPPRKPSILRAKARCFETIVSESGCPHVPSGGSPAPNTDSPHGLGVFGR